MGETELRVAAKAIDGFIARVGKLETENAELKAEVERLRVENSELKYELNVVRSEAGLKFPSPTKSLGRVTDIIPPIVNIEED